MSTLRLPLEIDEAVGETRLLAGAEDEGVGGDLQSAARRSLHLRHLQEILEILELAEKPYFEESYVVRTLWIINS